MNLFTPEELAAACRPLSEAAAAALDGGRTDELRYLLGRMSVGHCELYFGYLDWIARLAGKVLRDRGEARFEAASREVARFLMAPVAERVRAGDDLGAMATLVDLWVHQLGRLVPLGETEQEAAFAAEPCGSGGRLLLGGLYETRPRVYPRLRDGTPVFCRVCAHLQEALNEAAGRPFWTATPEPARTGHCRMRFRKGPGLPARLLSREDAERMTTPRCQRALEKLDRGQRDLHPLLADQHTEWRPLHDLLCLWVTALFCRVNREEGLGYLTELVWETYVELFAVNYLLYAAQDERSVFRSLARIWHYHQANYRVTEEVDRFVFHLDPCGSGGRLYRGEMGLDGSFRYGAGMLSEIREAADITFGRSPFPAYCIHCAATNRDQFLGKPWAFIVDGDAMGAPGESCRQYLYKKDASRTAPPALLAQVGLSEVEPLQKEFVPCIS